MDEKDLFESPSVILSKVRLQKEKGMSNEAYESLNSYMESNEIQNEVMKVEYIKLLIDLDKKDEVMKTTANFLSNLNQSHTKHYCSNCGYNSDEIFWRCPQCHEWETIQFRWKV